MIKKHWKTIVCLLAYLFFIILVEGDGYYIHNWHYVYDGANYTPEMLAEQNMIHFGLYQFAIITLSMLSMSWKNLVFLEFLWKSCFHDYFGFYGFWNNAVFPNGTWTWMGTNIFGAWTTQTQIYYILTMVASSIILIKIIEQIKKQLNKQGMNKNWKDILKK